MGFKPLVYFTLIFQVEESSVNPACTGWHEHTPTCPHIQTHTLSMIAATVSESPMMTHSVLRFHVPEHRTKPTHTQRDNEISSSFCRPHVPFNVAAEQLGHLAIYTTTYTHFTEPSDWSKQLSDP